jgi:hypothetical protein
MIRTLPPTINIQLSNHKPLWLAVLRFSPRQNPFALENRTIKHHVVTSKNLTIIIIIIVPLKMASSQRPFQLLAHHYPPAKALSSHLPLLLTHNC